MLKKLKFTSIPNFIKEYINRNTEKQFTDLKHFSEVTLEVLSDSEYTESYEGYRTFFRGKLKQDESKLKLFIADVFMNFYKSKLQSVNGKSVYDEELGIGNYTSNEMFKIEYEDEFGDTEKMDVILDKYDNFTYDISFMRV